MVSAKDQLTSAVRCCVPCKGGIASDSDVAAVGEYSTFCQGGRYSSSKGQHFTPNVPARNNMHRGIRYKAATDLLRRLRP